MSSFVPIQVLGGVFPQGIWRPNIFHVHLAAQAMLNSWTSQQSVYAYLVATVHTEPDSIVINSRQGVVEITNKPTEFYPALSRHFAVRYAETRIRIVTLRAI